MTMNWPKFKKPKWFKFIVPSIVLGLQVYGTWGFSHKLCYNMIYKTFHRESIAIGLITIVSTLDLVVIALWVQVVLIIGPGKQPFVPPFQLFTNDTESDDDDNETAVLPPITYQCDPHGYPFWCSECQSLKLERTHHSSAMGHCVPRFDHYCVWVGTVIGKDNYLLFLQFVAYYAINLSIIWVSIVSYIHMIIRKRPNQPHHHFNTNLIIILVFAILGWLFTVGLFFANIYYISKNRTSLEMLLQKHKKNSPLKKKFICHYSKINKSRYVVEFTNDGFFDFWNKSKIYTNIKEFLGSNILFWFIPLPMNRYKSSPPFFINNNYEINTDEKFSTQNKHLHLENVLGPYLETYGDETIRRINEKINNMEYITTLDAYGDKYMNENDNTL
ncbi:hypothetical protein TBLA_0E02830 [Henningerozyma blattae CBS 6284]|uniref:Palmitoyltransferase n=1 Tax=Henningerozyma blattae (strain ATCC 34711 / CBS 6284 / DSM 70876 / NBRC 10599 / NRRL Y-10934 / UCD 77-7) TaxID=1071380 RepID=I2H4N7_HENB6|nr:hypothetical protein TBLA_0E02830 [Tetrapisispora blattae CBS 6284]CCH61339.1 hypothetical protein TBLA_0E02830 [Tetrapisispora blattae CBS 6284]